MKIIKNEIQNLNAPSAKPKESSPTDGRNPKLLKAARMYEQTFLNEMVKAMRGTIAKSDLIEENMAEKIFKDQLYDKHVEEWTENGGIGLANLIHDEIMEKYQAQKIAKPQGPLPLEKPAKTVQLKDDGLYGLNPTGPKSSVKNTK